MDNTEKVLFGGLALFVFIIFGGAIFTSYTSWKLKRFCLSKGYPQVSLSYYSESYCIKRLDQTDVVTPVSELR